MRRPGDVDEVRRTERSARFRDGLADAARALGDDDPVADHHRACATHEQASGRPLWKVDVVARIDFGPDKFSITYRASENMGFEVVNGRPFIHPKYNQWIGNLLSDIRKELTTL